MTDVPPDFVPYDRPSPLLTAIGGFLRHARDPLRAGFTVEGPKTNARGLLHGGVIATVGDVVIGHALAVRTDPPTPLVTVNLSCDMVGTARDGDWVDVTVTPTRTGRRLAAGTATFTAAGRTIATVSALFLPASEPAR
ncbi:PaaI family thioesterase [Actinomadura sp. WMMB 499]|uniref:PaaI family thioesterase n=1 Tax=Actinomadura sp. WMMB 499 TaxID=1219491 RepID=UPI0012490980|nr:PaaI family thioesterase [Actinomadura sp. WMMB 499]QFG22070.1 PaaI family thioesterase [Actinomadura sp. WMMB 499]